MTQASIDHIKMSLAIAGGSFKGMVSNILFIGPILAGAWEGYCNYKLEDTIQELSKRLEKLGEEKIDKDFLVSEEFVDLFQKAVRIRLQHRSELKAKFIYGLLGESLELNHDPRFTTNIKELFLTILEQLSDEEILFLYEFSKGTYNGKSTDDVYKMTNNEGIAMDSLLAKRIIREESTWEKHLIESSFGHEFMEYLKLLAKKDEI